MTALLWDEAPIAKQHDRAAFDCGDADLNHYLQRYARKNHESGGAKCFVAVPTDMPTRILGFHTLSPASLEYARTPALAKRASVVTKSRCSASVASRSTRRRKAGVSAARFYCAPLAAACVSPIMSAGSRC